MNIWQNLQFFSTNKAQILANRKAGIIYVGDFGNKQGKYISSVLESDENPYDATIKISSKIEVRITYLIKDDSIKGVTISKVSGSKVEELSLSTLDFEGILGLLHLFSELDLKSITGKSILLDASIVHDEDALRKHLNTILADEKGSKILAEIAKATSQPGVQSEKLIEIVRQLDIVDPDLLSIILSKLHGEEKKEKLLTSLSELDLDNLSAAHKHKKNKKEINNLEKLLELEEKGNIVEDIKGISELEKYQAGQPEKIFQKWIEVNLWVFGIEYIKKFAPRKIALTSEADLLMESLDGFLDLIELKRPKLDCDFLKLDSSHKSYYPSTDLSQAIGQCLLYLQKMDDMKLILEKEYKAKIIRPRVKIIIGRTKTFNSDQLNALRMLNSKLNHIEIVSYDYLVSCGKKLIANLEE